MSQHYTRNTVSVAAFCAVCKKPTQHRIDDRRIGPCIPCLERPLVKAKKQETVQESLFSEQHKEVPDEPDSGS